MCNSLIYLISIVASPLCGMLVDAAGRNIVWIVTATIMTIGGHLLFAFTFVTPFVGMSIIGLAYSLLASSLWPCVAYIVPKQSLGTAYGLMQSIQNLGLALLFLSTGVVVEARGYMALEIYFLAFLCIALGSGILLVFVDLSQTGVLNMSKQKRKEFLELQAAVEGKQKHA